MICVSIGLSRHTNMIEHHNHVAGQGIQLVELRIDCIKRAVNLERLLKNRPCPVVVTCRRPEDGGQWADSEDKRLMLLRAAIAEGVEYVDLEDEIAGNIPRFGKTKRIVSYHNLDETPENLAEIHEAMKGKEPDIIKLATMAQCWNDCVRMLDLVQASDVPTVGFCLGDIGVPTRILGGRYGAPFVYATFHRKREMTPGEISYDRMMRRFRYDKITNETKVFGVLGEPIDDPLAPVVFNDAAGQTGQDGVFVPFRIRQEELEAFLGECPKMGVYGLVLSSDSQKPAFEFTTTADRLSTEIERADTLAISGEQVDGYNVLSRAAMDVLRAACGDTKAGEDPADTPLSGKKALVLGAGSAARAVAVGLVQHNVDVTVAARNETVAQDLAVHLRCNALAWKDRHNSLADIVVNCTPVGRHPGVDETPYAHEHIQRSNIVMDLVYDPEQTLLIKQARQVQCRVATGVDVYVRRTALQFKAFSGEGGVSNRIRERLKAELATAK